MGRLHAFVRAITRSQAARLVGLPVFAAAALVSALSLGQSSTPPTVSIAPDPLYARGARVKPTLTLALSVEYPTVGAQYVDQPGAVSDATYSPNTQYVGYFDTESCYNYINDPDPGLRRFERIGAATARACGGNGFSGNFMNWATSSAIDVLRYGLTGGDRVVDTTTMTVLQRAVLPNQNLAWSFFNGANFPSKVLKASLADGAVPRALRGTYSGDVYVANCLNRVHFGTVAEGDCTNPGNNTNLGSAAAARSTGPYTTTTWPLPGSGWVKCADEGAPCPFNGLMEVAYGSWNGNGRFAILPASEGVQCTNNMTGAFVDPNPGIYKGCFVRPYTGTWRPTLPNGTTKMATDDFFYSRVRVCETDSSGKLLDPRNKLCLRYPNGQYKPVGNMQLYADRVRVAAFGYLNDLSDNPQRYGGVLRAPMKYVGPQAFDSSFNLVPGANPLQEWDPSTGILLRDPDAANGPPSGEGSNWPGQSMSGVINYLNQFGRTGTFGGYKRYDPINELYYEALRYLQGLPPTSVGSGRGTSAIAGLTDDLRDGFPVFTTWTDPHPAVPGMTDYTCVKNNIVGIGDVNTWYDKYIPGNPGPGATGEDVKRVANPSGNEPDFYFWTKVVGGLESNTAVSYVDGKGAARVTSNPNNPSKDRWGLESQGAGAQGSNYYMAGMAYWANTQDIRGKQWSDTAKQRPGMRVKTYFIDVNEYGNNTPLYPRRNNQIYLAAKYGGFKDATGTGNPYKVFDKSGAIVDDPSNANWMRQSTDPNKQDAKTYFLSSSAQDVLAALDEIFSTIAKEANSIAGGAISTQRLTTTSGYVYQAQFDPSTWNGDIIAYSVTPNTAGTGVDLGSQDTDTSPWTTSSGVGVGVAGKLDELDPSRRNIYIGTGNGATFATSEFTWTAISSGVKDALRVLATDADSLVQSRVAYLRGDRSLEVGRTNGIFRQRGSRLGDIVNSGVTYVGAPSLRVSDTDYASFYSSNAGRAPVLYVGANDGMVHAFNADTGVELFAYIPSWAVGRLKDLTQPTYVHRPLVDATPIAAEAKVNGSWKTILVGGGGGGGQGVYALDVTNPTAVTGTAGNNNVLWEFTDSDDVDMGNVVGKPQILKINVAAGSRTPNYKYFAVVASGVNNHIADGKASSSGQPALFFLDLSKGKNDPWSLNQNYFKVKFPVSTNAMASGMIGFSVRVNEAEAVTYLYAGDLHGNLWKLDLTKSNASTWSSAMPSFFMNGSVPIPMYIARDDAATPNRQPISMEPALIFGPNRGIIVAFGTGKFLEVSDITAPYGTQSVYAVFDNGSATPDKTSSPEAAISGRGQLAVGTASLSGVTVPSFNWGRPSAFGSGGATGNARSGWYFDFYNSSGAKGSGERQVSGFGVLGGKLYFGTVIPPDNPCSNGSGNLFALDIRSGAGTATTSTVGVLGEPFLVQLAAGTKLTKSSTTGTRQESSSWQIILQGSDGITAPPSVTSARTVGRLSWREINSYNQIKNSP